MRLLNKRTREEIFNMNYVKKCLLCLLAAIMFITAVPAYQTDASTQKNEVTINTGIEEITLNQSDYDENGNYEIALEDNAFFPYEVQFSVGNDKVNEWFMTPDDSKEIGGHTFTVASVADGTVVTQMSMDVAGKEVVVYPKEKFDNKGLPMYGSLLPLEERYFDIDLSGFTPLELTQVSVRKIFAGQTEIKDTDKIAWSRTYSKDYKVTQSGGKLDLSVDTSYNTNPSYEMIVGDGNQLNMKNIRYIVNTKTQESRNWLDVKVKVKDKDGKKKNTLVNNIDYYDYDAKNRSVSAYYEPTKDKEDIYIGLNMKKDVFPDKKDVTIKVYKGKYTSAKEAQKSTDITKKIWNVCNYKAQTYANVEVTLVGYNKSGKVVGCLPMTVQVYADEIGLYSPSLYTTGQKQEYVTNEINYKSRKDGKIIKEEYTYTLYKGYPADDQYKLTINGYNDNKVTAAYKGKYKSLAAAKKAKAKDISNKIIGDNYNQEGYAANYSKGVWFTVFFGKDKDKKQKIYQFCVTTKKGQKKKDSQSYVDCHFYGITSQNDGYINSYVMDSDSYAENNFVTCFVENSTDLSCLALDFSISNKDKLYAAGSNTPEESGKSFHDFSKGAIQFTVSGSDGTSSKSYWVRVVKAKKGKGELFINSLEDPAAKTTVKKDVVTTTREVLLDSYHQNYHDIAVANIGSDSIDNLSVELKSDVVKLDKYWTLNGKYSLLGLNEIRSENSHGELQNLAMVRLVAKDKVKAGTNVSGTLTFKSGKKVLMVMKLTGTIGDPTITTKKIPKAVKYVPYGSMIQNSNKYSWNKVSYKLVKGKLPTGMKMKKNGELYGVPKKTGTYKFTVEMTSSEKFKAVKKKFTLKVVKNTDKNVDNATDKGYNLSKKIQDINVDAKKEKSYLLVSQGVFGDFVDVYLDGVKLKKDKDYSAESGSTRITIKSQTLTKNKKAGSHTIGVEFRAQDTKELKRAAQNYSITKKNSPKKPSKADNKKPVKADNKKPTKTEDKKPVKADNKKPSKKNNKKINSKTKTYKVCLGDTLWKIAEEKYGDGRMWIKIFEANKKILSDPKKLYVNTVIVLP